MSYLCILNKFSGCADPGFAPRRGRQLSIWKILDPPTYNFAKFSARKLHENTVKNLDPQGGARPMVCLTYVDPPLSFRVRFPE